MAISCHDGINVESLRTAAPEGPGAPTSPSLPGAPCEQNHCKNQFTTLFVYMDNQLITDNLKILTTAPVAPAGPLSPGLPLSPC